jgi:hypothetical protein
MTYTQNSMNSKLAGATDLPQPRENDIKNFTFSIAKPGAELFM